MSIFVGTPSTSTCSGQCHVPLSPDLVLISQCVWPQSDVLGTLNILATTPVLGAHTRVGFIQASDK